MQNTKLVTFLQTLDRFEQAQFRKYLLSPFFNENEELLRLYDLLAEALQGSKPAAELPSKQEIWRQLFPTCTHGAAAYDDLRFRRLCSDLLRLALDFAAYRQYASNPATAQVFLLHVLANTRLEKHFSAAMRGAELAHQKSGQRDADFHYLSYMLHRRRHEHLEHVSPKSAEFEPMEKADFHLDCYYFAKKLEHYCDALGYRHMVSGTAEVSIFPGFLDYLRQSPYLAEPAVNAWYLVAQMMLHPDDASFFQQIKQLLSEQAACFKHRELQTLFIHAMNYCIDTKINHGREDYYAELFALYQIALDREIIFDNGELNPHHYKNIITISLHIRELAWAEAFISKFTQRLPKADQENALNYNLAHVYYYQRRYDQVIELLREVEYQTTAYALGSRLLLLRTYFELREDQALESLLDSFRIFVRRNKLLSRDMKQQYLNMLRFARKLFNVAHFDKKAILKIGQEIASCKSLTAKKWLTEKAAEMAG